MNKIKSDKEQTIAYEVRTGKRDMLHDLREKMLSLMQSNLNEPNAEKAFERQSAFNKVWDLTVEMLDSLDTK